MASRHQRRKRAKLKRALAIIGEAQHAHSKAVAYAVKTNKSLPRTESVILTDRFGVRHVRQTPAKSYHRSSVDLVGMGSVSNRGKVSKLYDAKDAKRIAKRRSE